MASKNRSALGSLGAFILFWLLVSQGTGVLSLFSGAEGPTQPSKEYPHPHDREAPQFWPSLLTADSPSSPDRKTLAQELPTDLTYPADYLQAPLSWQSLQARWQAEWHFPEPLVRLSRQDLSRINPEQEARSIGPLRSLGLKPAPGTAPNAAYWTAIYNRILSDNRSRLAGITAGLRWLQEKNSLSRRELAVLTVQAVQQIPYEIPKGEPFGLYPPPDVVLQNRGDCDSKSLLLVILLRRLGFDAIILASDHYQHAMAGIRLPSPGADTLTWQGREYAFTETTNAHRRIGELPADFRQTRYWYPIPLAP